jgi:hypothetical protein
MMFRTNLLNLGGRAVTGRKSLYSIKGDGAEICYPLEHFKEMLADDDHRNSYELEEWTANIPGDGTFWCKEDGEAYDSSESYCGTQCNNYAPRNGKSGRCRWHSATYSPTGKTVRIEKFKLESSLEIRKVEIDLTSRVGGSVTVRAEILPMRVYSQRNPEVLINFPLPVELGELIFKMIEEHSIKALVEKQQ